MDTIVDILFKSFAIAIAVFMVFIIECLLFFIDFYICYMSCKH